MFEKMPTYQDTRRIILNLEFEMSHYMHRGARSFQGSVAEYAGAMGSEEMKKVVEWGLGVRRMVHGLAGEALAIRMRPVDR